MKNVPSTLSPTAGLNVLLADADAVELAAVHKALVAGGHRVRTASDGVEAMRALRQQSFDVVVCDVHLTNTSPDDILRRVSRDCSGTAVIFVAASGSIADAVRALKDGASDYLERPLDQALLQHTLARVAERLELERQLADARQQVAEAVLGPAMVGRSKPMHRMFSRLDRIARSHAPVIVLGESGTGKELVARLIHAQSPRANGPFVALNCAAFPDTLLEAELFGHEKGAFTGATRRRKGRFFAATGGTLFLDEVAELPPAAQAKLLRVLQDGIIEPLGSDEPIKVDVRVVSATHRNLRERVTEGQFREDLLFRLRVLEIKIPPLRERTGDVPLLVEHFLARFCFQAPVPTLSARAWAALLNHPWPGNVRELEHAMQQAVMLCDGDQIDLGHMPSEIGGDDDDDEAESAFPTLAEATRIFEREYLLRATRLAGGRRLEAARLLGISRKNLWEKLRLHGLAGFLKGTGGVPGAELDEDERRSAALDGASVTDS